MKTLAQTVLFITCAIMLMGVLPNWDAHESSDDQVGSLITVAKDFNTTSARSRDKTGRRVLTAHVLGSQSADACLLELKAYGESLEIKPLPF